jgi:sigma-B regulation protein RsbU (phosphoserine phosphatase)
MVKGLISFFNRSFQRKLLLFNISLVILTTLILFLFLSYNFQTITNFSLAQNTIGMEQTVEDYLTKYTQEKATSTWFQIKAAQDNLAILGKTAQKIIDDYDEIRSNPALLDLSIFKTNLRDVGGALGSQPEDKVDTLIPPAIASNPQAKELLATSGLLNLNIDAIYDANVNNAFIYFVGNPDVPVTRAYPNIQLAEVLGDGVNLLFWKDFFSQNVDGWRGWYTDPDLQSRVPNPITVEPPYMDAAGQGMIVTMFYPLWDKETNEFAGAVGADITLNKIIENVLSIQVARTGFAFLMNGQGEIIAMPETGYKLFEVDLTEIQLGGLSYYTGKLNDSQVPAVQDMAAALLTRPEGVYKLRLEGDAADQAENNNHLVAFASLPPLSNSQYQEDSWRVVIVVPEAETFEVLYETDSAIREKSTTISAISLALAVGILVVATVISTRFSNSVTRDLRTLAQAAEQVSAKNYDIKLNLTSQDEMGQLGRTFESMAREIRDYTTNLEEKVRERTADLRRANEEITWLNEQLKDENLRLSAELDVARRLQMMVLPPDSETRAIADLDIACYMRPADEVGGDYYDVLQVGDSIYLGIGDVTGHGLPAGVIMLMAQTALLTLSQSGEQDMSRILALLNRVIYKNILRIRENKNMTLAVLRYSDREFDLVGQHESVIICRKDGQTEVIDTLDLGFPIGLEDDIADFILAEKVKLTPGDVMLLYTDGVTEAENSQNEMFGLPNLTEALAKYHQKDAKEILNHLTEDLYTFINGAQVYDDISMLVVKQK